MMMCESLTLSQRRTIFFMKTFATSVSRHTGWRLGLRSPAVNFAALVLEGLLSSPNLVRLVLELVFQRHRTHRLAVGPPPAT